MIKKTSETKVVEQKANTVLFFYLTFCWKKGRKKMFGHVSSVLLTVKETKSRCCWAIIKSL